MDFCGPGRERGALGCPLQPGATQAGDLMLVENVRTPHGRERSRAREVLVEWPTRCTWPDGLATMSDPQLTRTPMLSTRHSELFSTGIRRSS